MPNTKIPKKLFQTFKIKEFTPQFQYIVNTWKEKNPNYEYKLYDDNECEAFIKENFEHRIYNAYCRIIPGAYKADLWRYCVLYFHGGVYVDIDTLCFSSIDNFLQDDTEFMTPIDLNKNPDNYYNNLFNAFIASVPKSPILMNCIERIVYNVEMNHIPASKLHFSGPGILGRAVNTLLGLPEMESFVGKEGIYNNIHFLHFEEGTEYVKDKQGQVLFQNKNGNAMFAALYLHETRKADTICWVHTTQVLRP